MRAFGPAFLFVLILGAASVCFASVAMSRVVSASLALKVGEIADDANPKMPLRFVNVGERPVFLDIGNMEYFIAAPADGSNVCRIHARNRLTPNPPASRDRDLALVLPGEHLDVGDLLPTLRQLRPGKYVLRAAYSAPPATSRYPEAWRGMVASPPFDLNVVKDRQ